MYAGLDSDDDLLGAEDEHFDPSRLIPVGGALNDPYALAVYRYRLLLWLLADRRVILITDKVKNFLVIPEVFRMLCWMVSRPPLDQLHARALAEAEASVPGTPGFTGRGIDDADSLCSSDDEVEDLTDGTAVHGDVSAAAASDAVVPNGRSDHDSPAAAGADADDDSRSRSDDDVDELTLSIAAIGVRENRPVSALLESCRPAAYHPPAAALAHRPSQNDERQRRAHRVLELLTTVPPTECVFPRIESMTVYLLAVLDPQAQGNLFHVRGMFDFIRLVDGAPWHRMLNTIVEKDLFRPLFNYLHHPGACHIILTLLSFQVDSMDQWTANTRFFSMVKDVRVFDHLIDYATVQPAAGLTLLRRFLDELISNAYCAPLYEQMMETSRFTDWIVDAITSDDKPYRVREDMARLALDIMVKGERVLIEERPKGPPVCLPNNITIVYRALVTALSGDPLPSLAAAVIAPMRHCLPTDGPDGERRYSAFTVAEPLTSFRYSLFSLVCELVRLGGASALDALSEAFWVATTSMLVSRRFASLFHTLYYRVFQVIVTHRHLASITTLVGPAKLVQTIIDIYDEPQTGAGLRDNRGHAQLIACHLLLLADSADIDVRSADPASDQVTDADRARHAAVADTVRAAVEAEPRWRDFAERIADDTVAMSSPICVSSVPAAATVLPQLGPESTDPRLSMTFIQQGGPGIAHGSRIARMLGYVDASTGGISNGSGGEGGALGSLGADGSGSSSPDAASRPGNGSGGDAALKAMLRGRKKRNRRKRRSNGPTSPGARRAAAATVKLPEPDLDDLEEEHGLDPGDDDDDFDDDDDDGDGDNTDVFPDDVDDEDVDQSQAWQVAAVPDAAARDDSIDAPVPGAVPSQSPQQARATDAVDAGDTAAASAACDEDGVGVGASRSKDASAGTWHSGNGNGNGNGNGTYYPPPAGSSADAATSTPTSTPSLAT